MENVKTLTSHNAGKVFRMLLRCIVAMGYQVTIAISDVIKRWVGLELFDKVPKPDLNYLFNKIPISTCYWCIDVYIRCLAKCCRTIAQRDAKNIHRMMKRCRIHFPGKTKENATFFKRSVYTVKEICSEFVLHGMGCRTAKIGSIDFCLYHKLPNF
jgi:hypothetical protein